VATAVIPQFGKIAANKMAKPKAYASGPSKEVLAMQAAYDSFLTGLQPGEAGVVQATAEKGVKSIRMDLRYASKRTGINIAKTVVAEDPDRIEFTVGANGASTGA
jgi:hypothetical protein